MIIICIDSILLEGSAFTPDKGFSSILSHQRSFREWVREENPWFLIQQPLTHTAILRIPTYLIIKGTANQKSKNSSKFDSYLSSVTHIRRKARNDKKLERRLQRMDTNWMYQREIRDCRSRRLQDLQKVEHRYLHSRSHLRRRKDIGIAEMLIAKEQGGLQKLWHVRISSWMWRARTSKLQRDL